MVETNRESATTFAGGERVKINHSWEDRFSAYSPESFHVEINMPEDHDLDEIDLWRMNVKLVMVKELAAKLALGMLKGTLKYPDDKWSQDQWLAFEDDERLDQINYYMLRKSAEVFHGGP